MYHNKRLNAPFFIQVTTLESQRLTKNRVRFGHQNYIQCYSYFLIGTAHGRLRIVSNHDAFNYGFKTIYYNIYQLIIYSNW